MKYLLIIILALLTSCVTKKQVVCQCRCYPNKGIVYYVDSTQSIYDLVHPRGLIEPLRQ